MFVVAWGLFETNLEPTLWALRDENVKDVQPSTEKQSMSDWIKGMKSSAPKLQSKSAQEVFIKAADAAENLLEYRNAIIHGWLIGLGSPTAFIRNPSWNGERRSRKTSTAHVDENLLNMAIDSAWVLYAVSFKARGADGASELAALKSDVNRAWSQSGELRNLAELISHEKY